MCFKCFRKKPVAVKDAKMVENNPPPVRIAMPSMKFLVERYIILCETLNEDNWRIPFYTVFMYEAIKIGGKIESLQRKTREQKRLYRIYKKYEKHIDKLLKPPPIDPGNIRIKQIKELEPEKLKWFTKVEKFDTNGFLVSTEYLG
jgi:hypothetical protein